MSTAALAPAPAVAPGGPAGATASAAAPAASLAEVLALAEGAATVREAATLLRQRYAPLRVVVVDAFDMRHEPPLASGLRRLLWGAVSDGHCWQVSADPTAALAGFYLAEKT